MKAVNATSTNPGRLDLALAHANSEITPWPSLSHAKFYLGDVVVRRFAAQVSPARRILGLCVGCFYDSPDFSNHSSDFRLPVPSIL